MACLFAKACLFVKACLIGMHGSAKTTTVFHHIANNTVFISKTGTFSTVSFVFPDQILMGTLISVKVLHHSKLLLSPSFPNFHFTSNCLHPPSFLQPFNKRCSLIPKKALLCSISASNSTSYGGWEDLKLIEDSNDSSKLDQFQNFLVSIGIDDKKYAFIFMLGLISALAISRVRVSSILVFPASILVFAAGFSLGFVRRGGSGVSIKEIVVASKKPAKEDNFVVSAENLRHLVDLFSELGVKVENLEEEMSGAWGMGGVQVDQFESYSSVIKSVSLDILRAKDLVEASIHDMDTFISTDMVAVDDGQVEKNLNPKINKRKRESGARVFDLFQFLGGLFQENATVMKSNIKDIVKREPLEPLNTKHVDNSSNVSFPFERTEEVQAIKLEHEVKVANSTVDSPPWEVSGNQASSQDVAEVSVDGAGKAELIQGLKNGDSPKAINEIPVSRREEFTDRNYNSQLMNKNRHFTKNGYPNGKDVLIPYDRSYDQLDHDVNFRSSRTNMRSFTMESKDSFQQQDNSETSDGYYDLSQSRVHGENENYKYDFIGEQLGDQPNLDDQRTANDLEEDSSSASTSVITEDLMFSKNLTEATNLLKEARECIKGKADEDRAEVMLYKSARLLSRAASLKPMSLLAVGQLGNTFLLHGELKLRISRELRTLLSRNGSSTRSKRRIALNGSTEQNMSKDRVASVLVDVCEECEGLLVEAGKQYKLALSIDGSDVRALYNWGLALSYRAQLIADVGPEAASDADRVYLAAIDKFNALMSKNKAYAPDALLRWGVALQQRSRLRPRNAKEKMKLLNQAKSLLEDALYMDSNNLQVREALSSCISELNYSHF